MSGGPRPQCGSNVIVDGRTYRCQHEAHRDGEHRFIGGYKEVRVDWYETPWQMMTEATSC